MAVGADISGSVQAGGYFGAGDTDPNGNVFGPGTVGRWMLAEWVAAGVWLLVVWRVVDGA